MEIRLPAAHDIAIATKDLSEATYYNICMRHHVDIQEVPDRLVYHDCEVESIRKSTYSVQIWAFQQRVSRKFAEQS